jgi:hypothetical protein
MLGIRDTRRVAWRRQHALRHYVGYVTVTEKGVRLAGHEDATGIDIALSVPYDAIRKVRVARAAGEEVVGGPSVALELHEDEPIFVRPLSVRAADLDGFARKLRSP